MSEQRFAVAGIGKTSATLYLLKVLLLRDNGHADDDIVHDIPECIASRCGPDSGLAFTII